MPEHFTNFTLFCVSELACEKQILGSSRALRQIRRGFQKLKQAVVVSGAVALLM